MTRPDSISIAAAWFALAATPLLYAGQPNPGTPDKPVLSPRNAEAPFCYVHGGTRRWPVFERELPSGATLTLTAKHDKEKLAQGSSLNFSGLNFSGLNFSGLSVSLSPEGTLEIVSDPQGPKLAFDLEVTLTLPGKPPAVQTLAVYPAPPNRPLSYIADFGDDIIRMTFNSSTGKFREITKSAFDQYFRRIQARGITRLIVWLSPFPYFPDRANTSKDHWDRYEKQARAIIESPALSTYLDKTRKYTDWGWKRAMLKLRLMRDLGPMITTSAAEHGIRLSASFRPFEIALTKYYEIPAFDTDGTYLWGFLPMATPLVNYDTGKVGFAHYRTVLARMGHADQGRLDAIEIPGVKNPAAFIKRFKTHKDNLQIIASSFPPLQEESLVLHRQSDGAFTLRPYRKIRAQAQAGRQVVTNYKIEHDPTGTLRISELDIPDDSRFIILTNPSGAKEAVDLPTRRPVLLRSKAGNRIGRENVYWVLNDSPENRAQTRVAGVPPDCNWHTEFKATQNSINLLRDAPARLPLLDRELVIDLGSPWSVEMEDFNRPAARENAIAQLKSLLAYPAFDEIFINTRSHTQLASYMADGEFGIQPVARYWKQKKNHTRLSADRTYAPISVADDAQLKILTSDPTSAEKITTWQPGEWDDACQSDRSPYRWRFARNRQIAAGLRKLFQDLQKNFPGVRTRVVIPPRASAVEAIKAGLESMKRPDGSVYGREYYRQLGTTINHIPAIGEAMAMVDLRGLDTEPVFFGIRVLADRDPFRLFVDHCRADMANNHGSSFRGPRSFFYEAHETLRYTDKQAARDRREEIICELLAHKNDINEVILYEAASWVYPLPYTDPDLCGSSFLDRCLK